MVLEQVSGLDARTRGGVESLARLLHQPKDILPCIGWRELPNKNYIAFVFDLPSPLWSPASLQRILFEPSRDIYRHPERQGQPTTPFKKIHDICSLGVVLLEIGLWEPAIKLQRILFAPQSSMRRCLESRAGKRYKEVVLKCLQGDFGVEDNTYERGYEMLDVIEQTANSV